MPTISPTYADIVDTQGGAGTVGKIVTWGPMANGDTGSPVPQNLVEFSDRSFQVEGTFGTGGALLVEGSNDKSNFRTVNNINGLAISITSAGIQQVTVVCAQQRPHVNAGDTTTSLTVTAVLRRMTR